MAMISLGEASSRLGVPPETLQQWAAKGLLNILREQYVEEDQVFEVAESIGWLHLSAENWDGDEKE